MNLADPVQTMLMAGDIDMGHARALLSLDRATQITAGNRSRPRSCRCARPKDLVKKIGAEFNLVPQNPRRTSRAT